MLLAPLAHAETAGQCSVGECPANFGSTYEFKTPKVYWNKTTEAGRFLYHDITFKREVGQLKGTINVQYEPRTGSFSGSGMITLESKLEWFWGAEVPTRKIWRVKLGPNRWREYYLKFKYGALFEVKGTFLCRANVKHTFANKLGSVTTIDVPNVGGTIGGKIAVNGIDGELYYEDKVIQLGGARGGDIINTVNLGKAKLGVEGTVTWVPSGGFRLTRYDYNDIRESKWVSSGVWNPETVFIKASFFLEWGQHKKLIWTGSRGFRNNKTTSLEEGTDDDFVGGMRR